ncbi:MAG: DegT/DnrJ/EryC1/StrS family aminotransferase [Lentisphaerae bacterium]|nr:DegT/DnrJ/EryC1/StrS family aminotransferase [Lentisphaerota bacterium]MCP4100505.1 DegT/DnrJ/EryC1/StrS family aminotransferase [Lentisphaerota bacterium]
MQVPLLDFSQQYVGLKDEILKEISEICDSQRFVLGEKVQKLENEIAEYCGTKHACGVTSGSDALIIALMVENIGAGDEVITTPFTFFATVGAISRVGATPVFVDIDPDTYNIDPAKIEEKITSKTKAIIPVHLFGQCCDMDAINAIASKHNLVVIEDACQSIGAEYKGKRAGSIGDYGCFSFYPTKNLGCFGDGGMVTANDDKKAELLKVYRNHGQGSTYIHHYVGGNFRLDALQAAVLSIKLRELDAWSEARTRNAAEYNEMFTASKLGNKIQTPFVADFANRHIYNQYSILVKDGKRDELRTKLLEKGVGCGVYYPLSLHQQECFKDLGYKDGDMPVSEQTSKEILALPIFPESTIEQRKFVVESIENILCS